MHPLITRLLPTRTAQWLSVAAPAAAPSLVAATAEAPESAEAPAALDTPPAASAAPVLADERLAGRSWFESSLDLRGGMAVQEWPAEAWAAAALQFGGLQPSSARLH